MNPMLDICTDVPAMQALLQRALPGFADSRLRIDALRVHKARRCSSLQRNPHPIALCYELQVHDHEHGRSGAQWLYAKMFRNGASADGFASIDRSRLQAPAFGDAVVHVAELDMVLWALPNDPGLPQLAALSDPQRLRSLLPWAALAIDPQHGLAIKVEMQRYEPEQRATLRCTLTRPERDAPLVLFAKTFCDARGRAIDERFRYFWQHAQADPNAPLVAPPLGYDAATQTAWQASIEGVPLLQALAAGNAPALLANVLQALATLHAAPLAWSRERPLAHWRAEARRRQTKIARAEPALAARAAMLVETLDMLAERWPDVPLGLIHGDFHPDQVWLHQGRVVLFDFDEFTLGDPLEDIAEFAVKLGNEAWSRAFIAAAAAIMGAAFDPDRLRWHLAVQCLLQASRAFIFQRDGWRAELARWLAHAEREAAALDSKAIA
jgi:aminoglycoside phosphotransferase (APT) family kinase protein